MALYNEQNLNIFNSISSQKEDFKPISEGYVGMYVVGQRCTAMCIWETAVRLFLLIWFFVIYVIWVIKCVTFVTLPMRGI